MNDIYKTIIDEWSEYWYENVLEMSSHTNIMTWIWNYMSINKNL